ncbi:MAG: MarR family winged helix-turn-helix transcriptional regulator, partial [Streptosporangiaceae bacterium]
WPILITMDATERSGDTAATAATAATAEALYGLMTAAVRRRNRDISLTSAAVLGTVERTGPRRITDLAAVEGIAQPSMTTLVSNLERAGLVERHRDAEDQRVVLVALTQAGADYLRARRRAGADAFVRLIVKLPPAEAQALMAATAALVHLRDLDSERSR